MEEIILASASPRRKELLEQIGIPYKILPSGVEEDMSKIEGTPEEKVEKLALNKAMDVAGKLSSGLVLGADTAVVLGKDIMGKPKTYDEGYSMLKKLSSNTHLVITGLALINAENMRYITGHEITEVVFDTLTDNKIKWYLETGEYKDKAGSYGIQGKGAVFVKEIRGCYFNVVGLPLFKLTEMLERFGYPLYRD